MLKYLARRLAWSVFVLVGLSMVIFVIARVVPGDPVRMALGPRASQESVDQMRQALHLDKPLPVQYVYWLSQAVRGDLGVSLFTRRPVMADLKSYLPATFELVIFAALLEVILGILLGVLAASHANSWVDNVIRVVGYLGVVTPPFVFAALFMLIFGYWWQVLPTVGRLTPGVMAPPVITGMTTLDSLITGNFTAFFDALKHIILPAIALCLGSVSQEARITRSSMVDNLGKDYYYMAIAQGVPRNTVMRKYMLKPSLIPTVSVMGLDMASLLANAFLVELIFNWPGFARYGINVMLNKDLNAIQAVVIVVGLTFVVVNIIVDLVVAYLDPRVRLGSGSRG